MARDEADRGRLDALFRPRSIAIVGATERSIWSNAAYDNLKRFGFDGPVHLVNRKGGTLYGQEAVTSVSAIGGELDLALVMVPENAVEAAMTEIVGRARSAVILTSGFAETGDSGRVAQEDMAARARAGGTTLLGPNCLGFINFVDHVPVWTTIRRRQRETGTLAVVSQSGAVGSLLAEFGYRQSTPFSYLVSTGNEADVDLADVLDHLASDSATRAIALFIETVRNPVAFAAAADRARASGKAVVALKIGAGETSARVAQAHTGALVGDDRVFDAVCERYGIVRVNALEDLIFTADLLARGKPVRGRGIGFVAMSGGTCEIAADRFDALGCPLPVFAPATEAALVEALPGFGTPHNPLDVTGGAMLDPRIFTRSVAAIATDPAVDGLVCLFDAPESEKDHPAVAASLAAIGDGIKGSGKPAIVFSNLANNTYPAGRAAEGAAGVYYSSVGLDRGIGALVKAIGWWARPLQPAHAPTIELSVERPSGERAVLDYLAGRGVPVIPAVLAVDADAAVAAARSFGGKVAMKIAAPDLAHKSDAGGVALGVAAADAEAAFVRVVEKVREHRQDLVIDGVLVSPMREGGVELIVGVVRDPVWGFVISVGLGGVFVELLKDAALKMLPVTPDQAKEMLLSLKGAAILQGFRGSAPIDLDAAAAAIVAIGDAAVALGSNLAALEVNPLLAQSTGAEALDALSVWNNDDA